MKEVIIYTDGACRGNPGPGGFAAVLMYKGRKKIVSGSYRHTTNNRMEMMAVIKGLQTLRERCKVSLFSDSKYICDAVNKGWMNKWKRLNWKRTPNDEVKNPDLWQMMDSILKEHSVTLTWVKGHAENQYNNEADEAAVKASKRTKDFKIDIEFEKVSGLSFG